MEQNIREFLFEIENDFIKYLYNNHTYPSCCHVASNLVASFLNLYSREKFTHMFYSEVGGKSHSWVQSGNFVYDLVWYQDELNEKVDIDDLRNKFPLDDYIEQLKTITRPEDSVFDTSGCNVFKNKYFTCYNSNLNLTTVPDLAKCRKGRIKLNRGSFLRFIESNGELINYQLSEKEDTSTRKTKLICLS